MRAIDKSDGRIFEIGVAVRFKDQYLISRPDVEKRFAGRVGKVSGYRMGAVEPIVEFPRDGRRTAQKIFEVSIDSLELVDADIQKT